MMNADDLRRAEEATGYRHTSGRINRLVREITTKKTKSAIGSIHYPLQEALHVPINSAPVFVSIRDAIYGLD